MTQLFTNDAVTLLAHAIGPHDTQLIATAGQGVKFPDIVSTDDFYLITIENWNTGDNEICKVVAKNGDVFTVERAQEDTIASSWDLNCLLDHRLTAGTLRALQPVINAQLTVTLDTNNKTVISTDRMYQKRSTQLYIGGLRQALDVDYIELNPMQIKLQYPLSLTDIADGQNVVLDFMPK